MAISTLGFHINKEGIMGNTITGNSTERTIRRKKHTALADFGIRLVKEKPLGTIGAVIAILLLLTGIFANFLAPYGMNELHMANALEGPNSTFLLGTDNLGRDILSRIIFGARISVIVGLTATLISTFISTLIGILSAYIGGLFDLILQRFVDAVMSLPGLALLMVIISIIGPGMWQVIICLGITGGIGGSRMIRGIVIGIKGNIYLQAAVAIGCPAPKLLLNIYYPILCPI